MENNKILAAILCAALLFMITGFISEGLSEPEHLKENAYKIEVAETASSGGVAEAPKELPPIAPLLAAASAADGMGISKKCAACHNFDKGGPNKVGPNLWGIVNNKHAHAEGFAYSDAIKGLPGVWDYESLNKFLHKPAKYAPGTKMNFAGISSDKDRANLIAYLRSLSDNPAPLPK
ncbi:MAG: cytochrome c family protein [Alphaproteobacteria bacterium]|nr:MAG: cytochrome c family protein [Alphaproteobacteria bacterium]